MLNDQNSQPYKPEQAIIVYKKDGSYYLESHSIEQQEDKFLWGEGKPLSTDTMVGIARAFGEKQFEPMKSRGCLPENLIYLEQGFVSTIMAWYYPAQQRMLHFSPSLKIKSGLIQCPPMLFVVNNRKLYVFALPNSKKPTDKTKLLKAPFFNQYNDGSVCMGNTAEAKKKPTLQEDMKRWERRYFGSAFTHLIDAAVINKRTNLSILYNSMVGKKEKLFPMKELVPASKKTVGSLLKTLTT